MRLKSELILLFITFIWAGTFAIIKLTLEFISPMLFVSIRFFIAALIIMLFFHKKVFSINKSAVKMGAILGFFLFVGFVVQTIGLKYTTATKSALITGTFVVFTPILQIVVEKKPPRLGSIIGVIIVFIGLLFLSSKENSFDQILFSLGKDFNIGDALTFVCAISFAAYIVYLDIISDRVDYVHLVWMQILVTGIGAIILMGIFDSISIEKITLELNANVIGTIIYTTIFATVLTTFLQTKYQKFTTPTRAAVIFTSEPLIASILAYLILNETIGIFGIIGGGLIILGVLTSEVMDDLIKKLNNKKV